MRKKSQKTVSVVLQRMVRGTNFCSTNGVVTVKGRFEVMQIITKEEAKAQGLTHYYTGKPCNRGHDSKRYVSVNKCVQCVKDDMDKWREENRERYLADQKDRYQKDKKTYIDRAAKWRMSNMEKRREICRKYYWDNWDKECLRRKDYAKRNPDKVASRTRFYQARKRQATLKGFLPKDFERIYQERDRMTEATGLPHHVDHIVPLVGKNVCGLHVPWNLQILTADENRQKSNKMPG